MKWRSVFVCGLSGFLIAGLIPGVVNAGAVLAESQQENPALTGSETYTEDDILIVPPGVTRMSYAAVGGPGGHSPSGARGGRGAGVSGDLDGLVPGQVLSIRVGKQGGFAFRGLEPGRGGQGYRYGGDGGRSGRLASSGGAGGGGSSAILVDGEPRVVAAGGGGAGGKGHPDISTPGAGGDADRPGGWSSGCESPNFDASGGSPGGSPDANGQSGVDADRNDFSSEDYNGAGGGGGAGAGGGGNVAPQAYCRFIDPGPSGGGGGGGMSRGANLRVEDTRNGYVKLDWVDESHR